MQYLMHHLLRDSAAKHPDKEALVQDQRRFSYQETDNVTNRLSHVLKDAGTIRGDRVGVFLSHSLEQAFSFFGILKVGGAYVPINSLLHGEQVDHIANNCKLKGLILDVQRLELLKKQIKNWSFLEYLIVLGDVPDWTNGLSIKCFNFEEIINSQVKVPYLQDECIGSDLAALLYTSGSTGKPKGVMISHDNLMVGARIVTSYVENVYSDRLLGVLPLSFDAGLNQLTSCVLMGMTYIMKSFSFPGELVDVILKEKITGFAGIPTVWLLLLQIGSPVFKNQFKDLRYITNTGGALPTKAIEKLKKVFPDTKIFLMYGLTEAFRSTYLPPDQINIRPTSMGKAIPGCEMMVVNKEGELCKPEEAGELVHRGPTVSLGYWADPDKTAKMFKHNPFLPDSFQSVERVVYTGDIVKKDKDGYLYFVGRQDYMIKCYGHRISPSEIEEVIYKIEKVKLVAAIGIPDPIRGQSIKVFVALNENVTLTEDELMDHCAQTLPQFMMPRYVEFLKDLPKTGTGKIDVTLLKKIENEK